MTTTTTTNDPVNHPDHYTHSKIECIEAIEAALGTEGTIAFCKGNALKYVWRANHKGRPKEDLEKAVWYLQRAAKLISENDGK